MNYSQENSKIENIIWDWNGTLLDDVSLCVKIANRIVKNHINLKLDIETYKNVFGFPVSDYYNNIGIDFKKESFEELTKKFVENYNKNVMQCKLHKNVIDTLNRFKEKNINQHILTAAHKESVLKLLNYYSIKKYFNQIEGLDNYKAESKIDIGLNLIEENKINKETAVLIGDTIHDYEVANKLKINCILIANGHQSKKRLIDNTKKGTIVINELSQLSGIILNNIYSN
ncbi:MAG: HAD family hydrolase [Bacteroidales bacterium]|nr:HAD family hydrolase [Bacteroidales bacterium]MBN2758664.1 HAD family hydrolase [Bacteroidales bacterium]